MINATSTRIGHRVKCWNCAEEFDLLDAIWCGCGVQVDRPSKICPHCLQCLCLHPDYKNEALWGAAPRYLKLHGFDKIFYLYL